MGIFGKKPGLDLDDDADFQESSRQRKDAFEQSLPPRSMSPQLPPQSTLWRFLAGLHLNVPVQILRIEQTLRQRVWEAANVTLETVTLDTDTTVHTVYGKQMGARKGYNPKNKGKLSYQPILTFVAETREYLWGGLRNGDRPTGKQIRDHLQHAIGALPT